MFCVFSYLTLVKVSQLERGQRQLEQQQAVFDKINSLVEVVVSKTSQFDQLDIRLKSLELSLMGQQHKLQMIGMGLL